MRIVGIRRDGGGVEVASLSDDGTAVTVVAGLDDFWADAAAHLARTPAGETVAAADVEFVPPVLPGARVVCIGLKTTSGRRRFTTRGISGSSGCVTGRVLTHGRSGSSAT